MTKLIKKVAAIHDLSGYGRASLTTIIPILSTMGVQVCPVPTAILSTHTGGFTDFSFMDLTKYMVSHINHWKKLKLSFDCIYSGFLGSSEQVQIVEDFIDYFGDQAELIVVDPVMGDDGKLYGTMTPEIISEMRNLIKKADIITPNYTELMYLLGKEYDENLDLEILKKYIVELSEMSDTTVIATSIPNNTSSDIIVTLGYEKESKTFWKIENKKIPISYPGTGDSYTSVLIGNLLRGNSLPVAMEKAMTFVSQSILTSYGFDYPKREGVMLESCLPILNTATILNKYEKLK